jgi:DNA-binding NarL/FixJ family response regulator
LEYAVFPLRSAKKARRRSPALHGFVSFLRSILDALPQGPGCIVSGEGIPSELLNFPDREARMESTIGANGGSTGAQPRRTRILLVDDHELVRKGLRALLESCENTEICGEAKDGREAVQRALELRPDVVVMDICMPELNGLEAAREIKRVASQTEVLALTVSDSEQLAEDLLKAGVRGYLLKSDAGRDLVRGVEALQQDRPFFTPKIAKMVLEGYLKAAASMPRPTTPGVTLTTRERHIVQLLAEGKTNKEIAEMLSITVKTAETHRANIMHKLNLHSVGELVHYAVRNEIIEA